MTMTFGQAGLFSLLGIGTVFFALVLLMCIIKIMTAIGDRTEKKAMPAAAPMPAAAAAAPVVELKQTGPLAPGSAGELKLYDTDPRDAAMIMAIVADTLQAPVNELRFLSIREIKD